jgi:hypothetical protein
MTMAQLLKLPLCRLTDGSGAIIANGRLYSYLTGTTTAAATYTTPALTTSHGPYAQADAGGLLPPIYLDPAVIYRFKAKTAGGAADVPGMDFDPAGAESAADFNFNQTGTGAVARTIEARMRDVISVKDFGAAGDGTTNDAAAFQAALDYAAALGGATVYAPSGRYLINTTLTIAAAVQSITIAGASKGGTVIVSGVVGAAAEPLIKITSSALFFTLRNLELQGNSLTGSSGNGHALACISPGGLAPSNVSLLDVAIRGFRGTGKDEAGSSIPACGWYAYRSTDFTAVNALIARCGMGVRFKEMDDSSFHGCLLDAHDYNCYYFETCHALSVHGGTAQDSGSAGATDGIVYVSGCESISWFGGEMKNGDPYLVNAGATNIVNNGISLNGLYLSQLDNMMGDTAIVVGNAVSGMSVENCYFLFVNTMSSATGIEIVQNAGGYDMGGLSIRGNEFVIGSGGTIAQCIYFNSLANRCDAPVIESNTFGNSASGSATNITDAILIVGDVRSARIQYNTFLAGSNWTITDAIHLGSSVANPVIVGNEYAGFGTLTNQVNNAGGVQYERRERASGCLLSGNATYDPANLADGAGVTTTVTVTGAALGDYVEGLSFSLDLQGILLTGYVSAANTVGVRFQNETGGAINLASGTLRAKVRTK